jgi:hypothetical protein
MLSPYDISRIVSENSGTTITNQNFIHEEIKIRLNYFNLPTIQLRSVFFSSVLFKEDISNIENGKFSYGFILVQNLVSHIKKNID